METTEKVVEAYCRYVRGCFTIPNIKCDGQYEIDLLAIKPIRGNKIHRYHIESGVSISGAYSKLTAKTYSPERLKQRVEQAGQRRTMGYFIERKFGADEIKTRLEEYGFKKGNYTKVIVTWGWTDEAHKIANRNYIELWDFRKIIQSIGERSKHEKTYFTDDTLRTLRGCKPVCVNGHCSTP